MTGITRRGALGTLAVPAVAAALAPAAAQEGDAPQGAPQTVPPKPAFTLVLFNDIYRMGPEKGRGGFGRLAAIIKAERARGVPLLVCHAGDTFSPSLMSGFDHGAHIVVLTNMIRPDVFVPGNHEFDFGKEAYFERIAEAQFPVFAANMRDAQDRPLPRHRDRGIFDLGGIKVGVTGIALAETPLQSSPGDLKFGPIIETLREETALLRQEGADFLVAVTHTDRAMDIEIVRSKLVDVLLTGHDHDLAIEYDDEVAMAESNHDANFVTAIDIYATWEGSGAGRKLAWTPAFRIHDTIAVVPDPEVEARIKAFEADLSRDLDVPVARLGVELDSRSTLVRSQETAIGDLIADAMRASAESDVALFNGGGIRGNTIYPAGSEFTRRDVLSELPFGNKTIVTRVSGQVLLDALENGFSRIDQRAGRFPQVSGLAVTVDMRRPSGARVVSALVEGKPLDPLATYSVAANDYMLRGGDGYGMLAGGAKLTADSGSRLVANDVMAYARRLGTIDVKAGGRIVIER